MHHNNKCDNYRYHILRIGKLDFCNGCFANRIFIVILLPFYLWLLTSELNQYLSISLISYMLFQIVLTVSMALTGREVLRLYSGIITTIYLFGAHAIILYGTMSLKIPLELLLTSIIVLILPQFSMYLWKIKLNREFKYPIAKLAIRLSFVHAYFLTVLLTRHDPIFGISIIVLTSASFIFAREMSSQNMKIGTLNRTGRYRKSISLFLSQKTSGVGIKLDFSSPNTLIKDTNASQDIDNVCECCCGCCAVIMCCGTCGMCNSMNEYADYPVDY